MPWNGPRHGLSPIEGWDLNFKENHNKWKWSANVNTTFGLPLTIIREEGQSGHFDQFASADLHPCCISPFVLHLLTTTSVSLLSFTFFYAFIFTFFFLFLLLLFGFLYLYFILADRSFRKEVILLHREFNMQVPLHHLLSSCKLSYVFFLVIRVCCYSCHFGFLCLPSDSIVCDFH